MCALQLDLLWNVSKLANHTALLLCLAYKSSLEQAHFGWSGHFQGMLEVGGAELRMAKPALPRGSGSMLPQEIFKFLDALRLILVHSETVSALLCSVE